MNDEIQTLRQQLQQLHELHRGGALDDADYERSKARLERRLVDAVVQPDLSAKPASAAAAAPVPAAVTGMPGRAPQAVAPDGAAEAAVGVEGARPSRRLWAGVSVFVAAVALAGYAWKGTPAQWGSGAVSVSAEVQAGDTSGHDTTNAQLSTLVDQLSARLKERPDDGQGWTMLARSYAVLNRYDDAVAAYARALQLVGDDASLLADYADALGMKNNRVLGADAKQMIDRALKVDADNLKALSLAGTVAFTQQDYPTAVKHWEHLIAVAPPDSPFVPDVQSGIAEARQRGGLGAGVGTNATGAASTPAITPAPPRQAISQQARTAAAAAAPAVPGAQPPATAPTAGQSGVPAAGKATVSGTVSLSKALAAQAAPGDTVFIFARAADGPRMPLAILRKQVKDLPVTFTLDDSMAMAPMFKLSSFPRVVVGARVSKSGEAIAQKGDLSAVTAPVPVGATGLTIEIDQVVNP